jgi:hypothetical protein
MGCSSSSLGKVHPAGASPTPSPRPSSPPAAVSLSNVFPVSGSAATGTMKGHAVDDALSAAASAIDPPAPSSSMADRVAGVVDDAELVADNASSAIENTESVLEKLPSSLLDDALAAATDTGGAAVALVQSRAPVLASLCSCVANVFGAIAPAVPFAGAAAAVIAVAAEQGAKYIAAAQAAEDLRSCIASDYPTISKFAQSPALAKDHAVLLDRTCKTLREAAELLVKSYNKAAATAPATLGSRAKQLRSEVWKYFVAGTRLETLQGLKADLKDLVAGMAAAAAVDTHGVARATLAVVTRLEAASASTTVATVAPLIPAGVPNQASHDPNYMRLEIDTWLWAQLVRSLWCQYARCAVDIMQQSLAVVIPRQLQAPERRAKGRNRLTISAVVGDGGVGKSTAACEVMLRARDEGATL